MISSRHVFAAFSAVLITTASVTAQVTYSTGTSTSSTLVISSTLVTGGSFAGAVSLYAGNVTTPGSPNILAEGQSLNRTTYSGLFSAVGTTYGSPSGTTFNVPNLAGLQVVGANGNLGATTANSIALNYAVALSGVIPSSGGNSPSLATPFVGQIMATTATSSSLPNGWAWADGSLLPISENETLFTLLGATYGGDGQETFALPDLRGRAPIGNSTTNPLGNMTASTLAITFATPLQGIYPTGSPAGDSGPYLGEVYMFAFGEGALPTFLQEANGQFQPINQNQALFSLLGTTYGGNGQTTFALPDFRDRTFILAGTSAAAVPEASTFALAAGSVALGAMVLRRRSRTVGAGC